MNQFTHVDELKQANHLAGACLKCGKRPIIQYEPGCTFGSCDCGTLALPDWEPIALARKWNQERCGCFAPSTAGYPIDHVELVFTPIDNISRDHIEERE